MFRGFSSSVFIEITMISNSRSEHASSSGLIKGHQASEQNTLNTQLYQNI